MPATATATRRRTAATRNGTAKRPRMTVELPVADNGKAVAKVLKLPPLPDSKKGGYKKWGVPFEEFVPGTKPEDRQKVAATVWALAGQVELPGAVYLVTIVPKK